MDNDTEFAIAWTELTWTHPLHGGGTRETSWPRSQGFPGPDSGCPELQEQGWGVPPAPKGHCWLLLCSTAAPGAGVQFQEGFVWFFSGWKSLGDNTLQTRVSDVSVLMVKRSKLLKIKGYFFIFFEGGNTVLHNWGNDALVFWDPGEIPAVLWV